jgi:beta-lactamase superfamily II metal-dependent hydrolase
MSEPALRMKPPEKGAIVRMYCTGLGDCFLLGFRGDDGGTSYILIDCGVLKGTRGADSWMRTILQHIRGEVGERGLDLLVVTHAHWDHLSGFDQGREIFEDRGFQVKQVWLPWTENREDPVALRMAEERSLALRAAVAAAGELRARLNLESPGTDRLSALRSTVEGLEALLGFTSTEDLLDIVRGKVNAPKYVRPGLKPLSLGNLSGLRIYPLGPPTDPKRLGKGDPSKAPGQSEVYLAGLPLNEDAALHAAACPLGPEATFEERECYELTFPFDRWQRRYSREEAAADPEHGEFFRTRYLEPSKERAPDWRQVDMDWLEVASQLALNLDAHVNNTSLVLAFELGEGGPVLLFPGDAQVGNWLSWHELESAGAVTAESLLNRTVLYKVSHHGSHNATLKEKGLKMMTSTSKLVAMIPVDQDEAKSPKGGNGNGWAMPHDKLLSELEVRTEGRILRADRDPEKPETPGWSERWDRFREKIVVHKTPFEIDGTVEERTLFIQYTVTGES